MEMNPRSCAALDAATQLKLGLRSEVIKGVLARGRVMEMAFSYPLSNMCHQTLQSPH